MVVILTPIVLMVAGIPGVSFAQLHVITRVIFSGFQEFSAFHLHNFICIAFHEFSGITI